MPCPKPTPDVAAIKGRLDMAKIVANAVANRQRTPAANRILEVDGRKLTLTPRQVRRARERARSTGKPHNEARVTFVKILLRELTEQLTDLVEADNIGNNADRSLPGRRRPHRPGRADRPEPVLDAHDAGEADLRAVQQARHP